jgi:MFS family permease
MNASPPPFRVPAIIKRNMTLFALSQCFTGAGMSFAFGLGPLMVIALTGSSSMAGLAVGLIGLSRFLIAYPIGKVTDTFGRKPGILLGLTIALTGALVTGSSMLLGSFVVLLVGMLVFGMGMSGAQQLRVAATDMFPANRRAQALGYLALGSLVGLIVSPIVISVADAVSKGLGQDPLGLPWFMLPILIVPGMIIISFVRPDPKEIGMNLEKYYPGHTLPKRSEAREETKFQAGSLWRDPQLRLAILSNCAGQGNMSIVMVLTSLVLHHHGSSLTAIAIAHSFHSAGMFAFTIPLGKLCDRIGREKVMLPGIATSLVGAALVAFTIDWWSVTLGTFLVGLGWAASNVAATALIADRYTSRERGRAIGVNESFAGGTAVAMALVTGPLVEYSGLPATGLVAVLIALPPLSIWLMRRLRGHVVQAQLP